MSLDLILDHWELALLLATWSPIGVFAIKRTYDLPESRFTPGSYTHLTLPQSVCG